jgi:hypothetical protein
MMAAAAQATFGVSYAISITKWTCVRAESASVAESAASYTLLARHAHVLDVMSGTWVQCVCDHALFATTFMKEFVSAKSTAAASCAVRVTMNLWNARVLNVILGISLKTAHALNNGELIHFTKTFIHLSVGVVHCAVSVTV